MLFASYDPDTVTLTRLNGDGSHPVTLFSGDLRYPGCSPDGKFAFYANGHRPQKIWRISLQGRSPVELAPAMGDGVTGPLDVSPDGTLLAYSFDEHPPAWRIVVLPVGGGAPIKEFQVPGGIRRMRWSPAGTGLHYLLTQNGATNIWEQPLAAGEPKRLTEFTSGRMFDFTWSSDHKRLFLTRGDVTSDVVLFNNVE
jgi:Tol biopolymer transport system component